uniref:RNA helicase n=1 Tax=Panagrellus redivivus TaxID=6233 RepID=A0A7E4VNH0_PANRE
MKRIKELKGESSKPVTAKSNGVSNGAALREFAAKLPVREVAKEVLKVVQENPVSIIIGETGSGKSTQIPQILLDHLPSCSKIAVTQPRRFAARALAQRIADERDQTLGGEIGYAFRFERVTDPTTKITFMTDGILLNEALKDPFLEEYDVIIVDEAHERALHTDMLLMMLKLVLRGKKKRERELRVIVMSATLDPGKFSKFFEAPVYYISGRSFSTSLFYLPSPALNEHSYVANAVETVFTLNETEPKNHGILVFLPGVDEINAAARLTKERSDAKNLGIISYPLYSAQSTLKQQYIYRDYPRVRKVIYATNIAETSMTIPGIRIVIDSGKVKQNDYNATKGIENLRIVNISQAQAVQRAGRAGREGPGKCYRLYAAAEFDKMLPSQVPEVCRSNLCSLLLPFYSFGMRRMKSVFFIDDPSPTALKTAITTLLRNRLITPCDSPNNSKFRKNGLLNGLANGHPSGSVSASSSDSDAYSDVLKKCYKLTPDGEKLVNFPIDPVHGRILLQAMRNGCVSEAITILAFMSSDSPFVNDGPESGDSNMTEMRRKFDDNEGDHVRMLKIFDFYKKNKGNNKVGPAFHTIGLNETRLSHIMAARKQLIELFKKHFTDSPIMSCGTDYSRLRRSIAEALYTNVCVYDADKRAYQLLSDRKSYCKIHPSSCLGRVRANAIVFTTMMETTDCYANDVSLIDLDWVKSLVGSS